jgi:uncharacterized protein
LSRRQKGTLVGSIVRAQMVIDIYEAARTGQSLTGTLELRDLPRALELREIPSADQALKLGEDGKIQEINWQASFFRVDVNAQAAQTWCRLSFQTRLLQRCVRCLEPVALAVNEERQFVFVASEDRAAELDEDLDQADVLVGSKRFDLAELIEDELILALPPLAQHEVCTLPTETNAEDLLEEAPPNPFEALKKVDWGKGGGKKH